MSEHDSEGKEKEISTEVNKSLRKAFSLVQLNGDLMFIAFFFTE
jgi:hypothetical protein